MTNAKAAGREEASGSDDLLLISLFVLIQVLLLLLHLSIAMEADPGGTVEIGSGTVGFLGGLPWS